MHERFPQSYWRAQDDLKEIVVIVNLAQLRQQLTSYAPDSDYADNDPRRWQRISLEQQKKRAKELLKAVQGGDQDALQRCRRIHPAIDRSMKLSDAQLVIAHDNGFRKWEDLKAHTDHVRIAQQALKDGLPSALDAGQRTLHIRCGTDIQHKLAVAGFDGDFLGFWDPYVFECIPADVPIDQFVAIRSQRIGIPIEELRSMYRDLEHTDRYDSIALWFEYDAFDQLILARLFEHFSHAANRPKRLRFISTTHFPGVEQFNGIGQLPADAMRVLWNDFQDVGEHELKAGAAAWRSLIAPTPELLLSFATGDPSILPTMRRAFMRHLQELPSTMNGLSMTEHTVLKVLADKGAMKAGTLFGWSQNVYDPMTGMGDLIFWKRLIAMTEVERPCIRINADDGKQWDRQVELLPFGTELLNGQSDWLADNRIDRWVGGVHIDSTSRQPVWRFDREACKTIKA